MRGAIILATLWALLIGAAYGAERHEPPDFRDGSWKLVGERMETDEILFSPAEKYVYVWGRALLYENMSRPEIRGEETYPLGWTEAVYKTWGLAGSGYPFYAVQQEDGKWLVGPPGSLLRKNLNFVGQRVDWLSLDLMIPPRKPMRRIIRNPYFSPETPPPEQSEKPKHPL